MTTPVRLIPTRSTYGPGDPVRVELRGRVDAARLQVRHLGDPVLTRRISATPATDTPRADAEIIDLGPLPPGGYGIELAGTPIRTAVDVLTPDTPRHRYGFVCDYRPGRDIDGVLDNARRLHLTDIQFYDWAYRHADLLGGGDTYTDALDQPITLDTVTRLVDGLHRAGARALGYAAVYGVGTAEWPDWADLALLDPTGTPYALGDFLQLVDPAAPRWLDHFRDELRAATARIGFDGYHLDQYGYPKRAQRPDRTTIDVAQSFTTLIDGVRSALPDARLVFNNVNDFPTWRTAAAPQDAVYVEVWPPHTTLGHLADVVTRARHAAPDTPAVVAAYQHVYDTAAGADTASSDRATALTMATLFSHGATHLLCGEADRILTDPYYVRNHTATPATAELLTRWYDFAVEHGELLYRADATDVTGSYAGTYNDDCDVTYQHGVPVTEHATPATVWRRIVATGDRLVVHLINLTTQHDTEWDAPRQPVEPVPGGLLRVRRAGPHTPRIRVADPDTTPALTDVTVTTGGTHATAALPPLPTWQLILIDL